MYERSTILIAEDTEGDVLLLKLAFRKAAIGASLQIVPNGQEAIYYLSGTEPYENRLRYPLPDLLLLDLKMPVVDGFQVLRWLQDKPELRHIPVVALSSSVLSDDIGNVLALGANAYVEKPVGLDRLVEAVDAIVRFWLGQHRRPVPLNPSTIKTPPPIL